MLKGRRVLGNRAGKAALSRCRRVDRRRRHARTPSQSGDCRRRLWRAGSRQGAAAGARRRHRGRPAEPSLLPAAALSGGDCGALAGRRGLADPPHPARPTQRDGAHGGGYRRRSGAKTAAHQFRRHGFRLSGDRDRRDALLFRPRRMGRCRTRPQANRGRDPHSPQHLDRLRAGRDHRQTAPSSVSC